MNYDEMKPHCRHAIAGFNVLRRLGFESDNIFFEMGKTAIFQRPVDALFVCLRFGERLEHDELDADFAINVAYLDEPAAAMRELARATAALMDGSINYETYRRCMEDFAKEIGDEQKLIEALCRKKIEIPLFKHASGAELVQKPEDKA